MHNDKKIKEIKDGLCNYQIKPITIIKGTSGIGKYFTNYILRLYLAKTIL